MKKAIKKPVEIEFITFEDFVEYGKQNSTNIAENGMPWSFDYKGYPVTHENDKAYVIFNHEKSILFTQNQVLLIDANDKLSNININLFEATYDIVK